MRLYRLLIPMLAVAAFVGVRTLLQESCDCEACVPTLFAEPIDGMGFHNPGDQGAWS